MARDSLTANEALADGWAYMRDAWRDVWAVQLLLAAGAAMVFVSQMGRGVGHAGELFSIGAAVFLVALAPLYAALYRIEIGGKVEHTLGPLGLQLGHAEGRLWVIWLVRAIGFLFAALAVTTLSALVFVILRPLGMVSLGPLGSFRIAFLIAAAFWFTAGGLVVFVAARLSLSSPITIAREQLVLSEVWPTSARQTISLVATWIAVRLPSLGLLLAVGLIDTLENGHLAFRAWPVLDAILVGALVGGVLAFIQAPLAVGALAAFYRHNRPEAPRMFGDLAAAAPPPPTFARSPLDRPADPTARFREILGDRPEPARY